MFHTEMFSNRGRRILVLVYALIQMPPRVTNITCITQVTFKLINKGLLVRRLNVAQFQWLFDLSVADKVGWTVSSADIVSVDSEQDRRLTVFCKPKRNETK